MVLGSLQYVVECLPEVGNGASTAPCVTIGRVRYAPNMVQAYVLDPSAAAYIDPLASPFDPALAAGFLSLGIVTVLGIHLFSYAVGQVVDMVRHAR